MILLALLLACGTPTGQSGPVADAIFPHPSGYASGSLHGVDGRGDAIGVCMSCHGQGSAAPACTSCHASFPHELGWVIQHQGRVDDTCAGCHTPERRSCNSCHLSYPHGNGWLDSHGAAALARASVEASCGTCHGSQLQGTASAPGCRDCHAIYPHPEPFEHRTANPATCTGCHGDDLRGGDAGVSCAQCHPSYPHPADWSATHLATVPTVGEAVCLACHEPNGGPVIPAATCGASCHGGER